MVHPAGLIALVALLLYAIRISKERALIPFFIFLIIIPAAQRIHVLNLDFTFIRVFVYVLVLKAIVDGSLSNLRTAQADLFILVWGLWGVTVHGLLVGSMSGSVGRAGYVTEVLGAYLLGRSPRTLESVFELQMLLSDGVDCAFVLYESVTGQNVFHILACARIHSIRDGRLRCQGPFSHPILAGVFWATMFPLFFHKSSDRWRKSTFFAFGAALIVFPTSLALQQWPCYWGSLDWPHIDFDVN
jgi:hypothetical protein